MNLKEQLRAIQREAKAIIDAAKAAGRDITAEELATIEQKSTEAMRLKETIDRQEKGAELIASFAADDSVETRDPQTGEWSRSTLGGKSAYLALTGRGVKAAAVSAAQAIRGSHGAKAFTTPGTAVVDTPLESLSPIEQQKIPTSILEVLKTTQRATPAWKYLQQVAFTNNAAIVAPGAEKPASVITLDEKDGKLSVFAHLTEPIDKYMLEDNDTLVSFIASQMLYGLGRNLEQEVISGAGTTGHLTGLLNTSGIQTHAAGADKVTTLRTAATQIEVLGYNTDVFILNPLDWAAIETQRATSGTFDLGGPIDRAQRKVWGTQVVTSTGIPAGTALAMDLDAATVDRDTRGVQVEWDRSQGFKTNEIIGRVEGRFGLSVYRPDAIVKVTLPAA